VAYIGNIKRYILRRKYFTDKYMIKIGKKGERTYVPKSSYVYPIYVNLHCSTVHVVSISSILFQLMHFSNLAKYGHGPLEDGFKGDQNM
jgi:hypothetical protein